MFNIFKSKADIEYDQVREDFHKACAQLSEDLKAAGLSAPMLGESAEVVLYKLGLSILTLSDRVAKLELSEDLRSKNVRA